MESPTYWGAILAARQAGVRVVPVPTGPAGPDSDQLARAFQETGARLFYAQPNYANPTGAQWPTTLREQVLDVVRTPGTEWFPAEPTGPFVRLNYAGPNPAAFPAGARVLGQALT